MKPDEATENTLLGLSPRQWLGFLLLLAVTVGLRAWRLGHTPTYDEFFHFLAARAWLDEGTFCIADCLRPYDRGAGYTILVAGAFALLGDSVEAARMPSLLAGCLLVMSVFVWGRAYMSNGAEWVAAWCCALSPLIIAWSQTTRFYAPQGLLVWCGLAGVYAITARPRFDPKSVGILAFSALSLLAALHLQVSTLIPVAALGVWATGWLLVKAQARYGWSRQQWAIAGGALGVAAAATLLLWRPAFLADLWVRYRYDTNLMHADQRDNVFFYHSWFSENYSYFYYLLPAAVLISVARQPKPAGFAVTVFTVAFVAHSFGGFKGDRLILYALPFFFVVWSIALVEVIPGLLGFAREALTRFGDVFRHRRVLDVSATGLLVGAILFALVNLEAFQTTVRLVTVDDAGWNQSPWYRGNADWGAVEPDLAPLADSVDVLLSSESVMALYHFGRSDAEINRTQLYSADETFASEFNRDWRVGKPVVSQPSSVEQLMACYGSGLMLISDGHWRNPAAVPPQTADYIEANAIQVPTPRGTRTRAFRWTTTLEEQQARCDPETVRSMQRS